MQILARLTAPTNEAEYTALVESLDAILDAGGENESHPLAGLAAMVGELAHAYEVMHYPMPEAASASEMLAFLMEQHGLKQSDLTAEFGSQSVVSSVLNNNVEVHARP